MIDLEFVEKLIRAIDDSGIDHVEIERGGTRVRISKTPQPGGTVVSGNAAAVPVASPGSGGGFGSAGSPSPAEPATAPEASGSTEAPPAPDDGFVEITSPMVGTFYRSPSPDKDPFTEVGARISKGDTLCIIEAMKLMNELEADWDGVVREILVDDGEPVEYGQILFRVEPA